MKVIFVKSKHSSATTFHLGTLSRRLIGAGIVFVPFLFGVAGYNLALLSGTTVKAEFADWRMKIAEQESELHNVKTRAKLQIDALTVRMAELQARLTRLDALGERVADVAKLDKDEFDFGQRPAVGGFNVPAPVTGGSYVLPDLNITVENLEDKIADREQQLDLLESLLYNRNFSQEVKVDGWMACRIGLDFILLWRAYRSLSWPSGLAPRIRLCQ